MVAIGVTGHRVLAERGKLESRIDDALRRIEASLPSVPLTVISSLAEGADRLVARRVLARPDARLIVPLPLPEADYLTDFATTESKAEFLELLARADEVIVMPPAPTRTAAYAAAGEYVLDHCDVLLAVWDGQPAQGEAGTGTVVDRARERGLPLAWVRAGNRALGTLEPTTLGTEQGSAVFERPPERSVRKGGGPELLPIVSGGETIGTAPHERPVAADRNIPFRIRIGVTGDDTLPEREELAHRVREVLDRSVAELFDPASRRLLAAAPHTPLAFAVVTSLADGAERFVAKALSARPDVRLDVVLPFDEDDFRRELASPESREEFDRLLASARVPLRLHDPLPPGPGAERDERRAQANEELGWHLVDHCDVLLALGATLGTDDASGTDGRAAALVEYARTKGRPVILVSRIEPYNVSVDPGHGLSARSVPRLEMLNTWPVDAEESARYAANVEHDLFDTPEGKAIPAGVRALVRERLVPHYTRASIIAKYHQRLYLRAGLAVYVLSSLAVALVALGTVVHAFAPVAFGLEFVLLAAIVIVVRFAHRRRTHGTWIESRFLAERLRQGMFLAACGVEATRLHIPPYMGGTEQPDDWMVRAFEEIWGRLPVLRGCQGQACAPLAAFVQRAWVADQRAYHETKATSAERIGHALEVSGIVVFALALAAALGHLLLLAGGGAHGTLDAGLTFAAIVLPAVGAALGGLRAHRDYTRMARRSRNMATGLRDLEGRFARAGSPAALEALLRLTEDWMMRETQDWLLLMGAARLEAVS